MVSRRRCFRSLRAHRYAGTASLLDDLIEHGTITRFRLKKGMVGFAWQNNEPLLVQEPGEYQFDTPNFQFVQPAPQPTTKERD